MSSRPPQIQDRHLRRRAVVYLRQSSLTQLEENTGSTAIQRDLPVQLQQWGWLPDQIDPVDEDLGVTGSAPGLRRGFADLIRRMKADLIGLVAVTDFSRLSRNMIDLAEFVTVARQHDVLLAQGGQVVDFSDPNSEFFGLFLGINAMRENRVRADFGRRARFKKVEAGLAISAPPVGFVVVAAGVWEKHSDPRVREVLQLVFDKYEELGSLGRVVRWLRHTGTQVPRRGTRGQIKWVDATSSGIHQKLQHPAYMGTYVYGMTVAAPSGEMDQRGRTRRINHPQSEWRVIPDHHQEYVTRERWTAIQAQLRRNRCETIGPLGRGEALLQGLLRCREHEGRMHTMYHSRQRMAPATVTRPASYRCDPFADRADRPAHAMIRARELDRVVERELLATLTTPSVEILEQAAREALREHDALARAREDAGRRMAHAVAEAERAYDQAGPDHPYVRQRLADRLETALQHRTELQDEHRRNPLRPPLALDEATVAELRDLVADLPRLWRHPAVSHERRKQLIRALVTTIWTTPGPAGWALEIEWVGGARTLVEVPSHRRVQDLVRSLYNGGLTDAQIAAHLRAHGVGRRGSTRAGQSFTTAAVATQVRYLKLQGPFTTRADSLIRTRVERRVTFPAIAAELNAQGTRHRRGQWTAFRVQGAVRRLRAGASPTGAGPRPHTALKHRVLELHQQGLGTPQIVAQLEVEGFRVRGDKPVTDDRLQDILRRAGIANDRGAESQKAWGYIQQWAATMKVRDIIRHLNEFGLRTKRGTPWTSSAADEAIRTLRVRGLLAPMDRAPARPLGASPRPPRQAIGSRGQNGSATVSDLRVQELRNPDDKGARQQDDPES